MSRIYDHLKSLETQIRQEKVTREQIGLDSAESTNKITIAANHPAGRSKKDSRVNQRSVFGSPDPGSSKKAYVVGAVLFIGAGAIAVIGLQFFGKNNVASPQSGAVVVQPDVPVAETKQNKFIQPEQSLPASKPEEKHLPRVDMTMRRESGADIQSKPVVRRERVQDSDMQNQAVGNGAVMTNPATSTASSGIDAWESRSSFIKRQLKSEAYVEASKNAQGLARDFPERWEPWFWLGTAQLALGQMAAANAALEQAGLIDPKVAQIWIQRAVVAQERGDHLAAIKLLDEALSLSPQLPQIYLNLGYSNDALKLPVEAEKNYRIFLSLSEGDNAYFDQRKLVFKRLNRKHEPQNENSKSF